MFLIIFGKINIQRTFILLAKESIQEKEKEGRILLNITMLNCLLIDVLWWCENYQHQMSVSLLPTTSANSALVEEAFS
jgi:hypothetical protein